MFDLIVRDATGHTFGFSYAARSETEAKRLFYAKLRRLGKKTKRIKIIECYRSR